jgi:hypothetical protein
MKWSEGQVLLAVTDGASEKQRSVMPPGFAPRLFKGLRVPLDFAATKSLL